MNKYRNYSEDWLESSDTYGEHVSAMTGEKLHSKSDIAAELAWRDEQLAKANERVAIYKRGINKAIEAIEREDDSSAYDAISHLENALQLRKEQE